MLLGQVVQIDALPCLFDFLPVLPVRQVVLERLVLVETVVVLLKPLEGRTLLVEEKEVGAPRHQTSS